MDLNFDTARAAKYKSPAQIARVLTEAWVKREAFCPNCGNTSVSPYPNNQPVGDFYCQKCEQDYELKSKAGNPGKKIVDGAYETMMARLGSDKVPNLFVLGYDKVRNAVKDFLVVPGHFFIESIIEPRSPLPATAKRSGWVGCNILFSEIPRAGHIYLVKAGSPANKQQVLQSWQKTLFLKDTLKPQQRGWTLDVLQCVEQLRKSEFTLDEAYVFAERLSGKHPDNRHVKDKIRQQLQVLRDAGYIEFLGRGRYRLV